MYKTISHPHDRSDMQLLVIKTTGAREDREELGSSGGSTTLASNLKIFVDMICLVHLVHLVCAGLDNLNRRVGSPGAIKELVN